MMCADYLHLAEELDTFAALKIEWLHMDVMDGHYVPNFALGVDYCQAVATYSKIPQDIHLMIESPDQHLDKFLELPKPRITFHPETVRQPVRVIDRIKQSGASAGIALDPGLPLDHFKHLLPLVDQVLIMTVNPGYAGQKLVPHCIDKISETRRYLDEKGLSVDLEVDGNVSWENIPKMIQAGANILVGGSSSVFSKIESRHQTVERMRTALLGTC